MIQMIHKWYTNDTRPVHTGRMIQPTPLNPGDLVFTILVRSRYRVKFKYFYSRHGIPIMRQVLNLWGRPGRVAPCLRPRRPMSQAGLGNTKAVFLLKCDLVTISEDMAQDCDSQEWIIPANEWIILQNYANCINLCLSVWVCLCRGAEEPRLQHHQQLCVNERKQRHMHLDCQHRHW